MKKGYLSNLICPKRLFFIKTFFVLVPARPTIVRVIKRALKIIILLLVHYLSKEPREVTTRFDNVCHIWLYSRSNYHMFSHVQCVPIVAVCCQVRLFISLTLKLHLVLDLKDVLIFKIPSQCYMYYGVNSNKQLTMATLPYELNTDQRCVREN